MKVLALFSLVAMALIRPSTQIETDSELEELFLQTKNGSAFISIHATEPELNLDVLRCAFVPLGDHVKVDQNGRVTGKSYFFLSNSPF